MSERELLLPLTVKIIYESESADAPYVAYNPEFDISTCGPSEQTAQDNLHEAVEMLLSGAAEDGTLHELLTEAGFTKKNKRFKPPKVMMAPFHFTVPANVIKYVNA